jgi:drug/metabolite transporter superfamily protein YnfA
MVNLIIAFIVAAIMSIIGRYTQGHWFTEFEYAMIAFVYAIYLEIREKL